MKIIHPKSEGCITLEVPKDNQNLISYENLVVNGVIFCHASNESSTISNLVALLKVDYFLQNNIVPLSVDTLQMYMKYVSRHLSDMTYYVF